jgi:hypothetical protein
MLCKSILSLADEFRYIILYHDPVCGRRKDLMKPAGTFASQGKPAVPGPHGRKPLSPPQDLPDAPGPGKDKLTVIREKVYPCPQPELVVSNDPYPSQHIVS